MKVVFTDDVRGVARKGDVKDVKQGYFMNFLLPKKVAMPATKAQIKEGEERQRREMERAQELAQKAADIKGTLSGGSYEVVAKAHEGGKLYGAVHEDEIVEAIKTATDVELNAANIKIEKAIKATGEHTVGISVGSESFDITVTVNAA